MCKKVKDCKPMKKLSTLPIIDDEDCIVDLSFSNSIGEHTFTCSSTSLSPSKEDEDDELPVGILKTDTGDKDRRLKAGDLAWIKHSRKFCFWPSYIKAISRNKVSAFFISYNEFVEGEKSFRYSVHSKSVKRYPGSDCRKLIEECRDLIREQDSKSADQNNPNSLKAFDNALELADNYILYRANNEFQTRLEEMNFFHSNGLSLCFKNSTVDSDPITLNRPPTPVETVSAQLETPSEAADSRDGESGCSRVSEDASTSLKEASAVDLDRDSNPSSSSHSRRPKRKRPDSFALFNKNNEALVEFIIRGDCEQRLLDIFHLKIVSKRMKAYFDVWDLHSSSPKAKNLKLEQCYFGNESQLEIVCAYLQEFIKKNIKEVNSIVKKDELLFNVFLPEATIYSIHKVRRRSIPFAEKIFNKGYSGKGVPVDPILTTPLTDEERASVERRNREFAKRFCISP